LIFSFDILMWFLFYPRIRGRRGQRRIGGLEITGQEEAFPDLLEAIPCPRFALSDLHDSLWRLPTPL